MPEPESTNSREPRKPRAGPPPRPVEKLGLRDALAFILAAFSHILPYVLIALGAFVLLLLAARLLG